MSTVGTHKGLWKHPHGTIDSNPGTINICISSKTLDGEIEIYMLRSQVATNSDHEHVHDDFHTLREMRLSETAICER